MSYSSKLLSHSIFYATHLNHSLRKYVTLSLQKCWELHRRHQFTYGANRSTEDAVSTALHIAPCHLEHPGIYLWMLFIDYSSAFNTILPDILVDKRYHA